MPSEEVEHGRGEVGEVQARIATTSDLDGLVETLTAAFKEDPLWSWTFPDAQDLAVWWRFLIRSALRYPDTWIVGHYEAVSVWIPPGGSELTEAEESEVEPLLRDLLGSRTSAVMELLKRFDASHPRDPSHYYLSLLGVHPDHRGMGLGMALLAKNLDWIDLQEAGAYLESSNPSNDRRYERLGFKRMGAFTTPDDSNTVATMWRDARVPRCSTVG